MGRNRKKVLRDFIDDLPDSQLQYLRETPGEIFKDENMRLDMQGITSSDEWNLHIQVNFKPKTKSLAKLAPKTAAGPVFVPSSAPWMPEQIRQAL